MGDNSDCSDRVDDIISDNSDSLSGELSDSHNVDGDNESVVPRGRKRTPRPETWKVNVRKKLRNEGKAYFSKKANKQVEARKIGPPCRDKCFEKITMPVVEALFKEFWSISNYDGQTAYLQKLMIPTPVKRRRKPQEEVKRTQTISYCVMYGTDQHKVCKNGFLSIFGIGRKRAAIALSKMTMGKTTVPDQRGKNQTNKKIVGEKSELVRTHIKMLPTMTSHYSRAKSRTRVYMDSTLTVVRLYDLYINFMAREHPNVEKMGFHYYAATFRKEFNIGFSPPVVDSCNICDIFNASISNYKQQGASQEILEGLQKDLEDHKELARLGRDAVDNFNNTSDEVMALCFDLQQTLPTPKLSTNTAYYKRKLWTYNFCVHNLKTKKSCMYVWDEVTAKRGSCEIMSCLNNYIEKNHQDNETNLLLFSDNCAGQNKNINLILGCMRMLHMKKFFRIEHHFLVPGHSFLPCDSKFGNIELRIRRESSIPGKPDYINLIRNAVRDGFEVVDMQQEDFLNYEQLQQFITRRTSKDINLQSARVIIYDVGYMEGYALKEKYDMATHEDEHQIKLIKGRAKYSRKAFNLSEIPLRPRYNGPLPLTPEKISDLKDLIPYIAPLEAQDYLKSVVNGQQNASTDVPVEREEVIADDVDSLENLLDY